jgi:integrase
MARRITTPRATSLAAATPGRTSSARLQAGRPAGPSPLSLSDAVGAVLTRWAADGAHSEQTLARMGETVRRFAARLRAQDVPSFSTVTAGQARGFVLARTRAGEPPEVATQHARRTAVRTLYRTLRALAQNVGDPTLDLVLPPRGPLAARPLTEDEITLARASAQMTAGRSAGMRTVAWALGEATAVSSEITAVRLRDLDDPRSPSTVWLPGTRRHDPRTAALTVWGARMIAARADLLRANDAGPDALLAYGGAAPPGGAKAQASVCNALRDVLDAAGLAAEPDVRPSSLRHWAGRRAYDTGLPVEAVARLLGHRSLDATAEDIALDWRPTGQPRQTGRVSG